MVCPTLCKAQPLSAVIGISLLHPTIAQLEEASIELNACINDNCNEHLHHDLVLACSVTNAQVLSRTNCCCSAFCGNILFLAVLNMMARCTAACKLLNAACSEGQLLKTAGSLLKAITNKFLSPLFASHCKHQGALDLLHLQE